MNQLICSSAPGEAASEKALFEAILDTVSAVRSLTDAYGSTDNIKQAARSQAISAAMDDTAYQAHLLEAYRIPAIQAEARMALLRAAAQELN